MCMPNFVAENLSLLIHRGFSTRPKAGLFRRSIGYQLCVLSSCTDCESAEGPVLFSVNYEKATNYFTSVIRKLTQLKYHSGRSYIRLHHNSIPKDTDTFFHSLLKTSLTINPFSRY